MKFKIIIFVSFLFFYSCSDDCIQECTEKNLDCDCCPQIDSSKNIQIQSSIKTINIFIETSGSMKGYMPKSTNEGTSFQKLIPDILLRLKEEYSNVNLYSIFDSKSSFVKLDIDSARKNLIAKGNFSWSGNTYIPIMLDSINNYIDSNTVNIFISDLIYSPENSQIKLTDQSISDIRANFKNISNNFSTSIYNLKSKYIDKDNRSSESPYYLLVEGNSYNLKSLDSLFLKSFNTFDQTYNEIHFGATYASSFYTVLPFSENSGNFISAKCKSFDNAFVQLSEIDESKKTFFIIGMDLSNLPFYSRSIDYLKNNLSIKIDDRLLEDFNVLSKDEIKDKIHRDDMKYYEKCTNFLKINLPDLNSDLSKLSVALKNNRPDWINENNNSINISSEKTYGFNNIITGIEQAYDLNSKPNFLFGNLTITLIKE